MESDPIFLPAFPLPRFAGEGGPKGRVRERGRHFGAGLITTRAAPGYSLIELVLTILLISILAATMMTRFPDKAINLGAQAQQVASDIRYTQSLSMTRGERHRINFITSTTYLIVNLSTGAAVAHPTPITLQPGITWAPLTSVSFDGKGAPSSASDVTITLTASDGTQRSVVITRQTGRVTVP